MLTGSTFIYLGQNVLSWNSAILDDVKMSDTQVPTRGASITTKLTEQSIRITRLRRAELHITAVLMCPQLYEILEHAETM
jgi:hypothetical protein